MTPELRRAIFSLDLYKTSLKEPSDWLPAGQKREILSALQELFVKLAFIDEKAISTENLTKSFGWTGEEVIVQHDVQELSRVFFDCLERALQGTEFSELVSQHIKGKYLNSTICCVCNNESSREEDFADIGLRVKGLKSVEDSIRELTREDLLEGSNQYFCEACQCKVNAMRVTRFSKLPKLLFFSLNRFEYDLKTYERVKINSNFEFELEIDMSKFCEGASIYELFAVIIHGGGAHSGHYHVYLRDILGEGKWNPSVVTKAEEKPEVKSKRQGRKKNKNKKRNQKAKKEEKKKQEVLLCENEDFSSDPLNSCLNVNWYDFNDSTVTPIRSGKLKKQFGGSSETAYILIYRSKELEQKLLPEIPIYWTEEIAKINEALKVNRVFYEANRNIIEVQVQVFDLFDIVDDAFSYKDKESNALVQGISLRFNKTDSIEDLKNVLTMTLIDEFPELSTNNQIFLAQPLSNKCLHILKPLDSLENDSSLLKENISHKTCFLVLPKDNEQVDSILEFIGPDCEPLSLSCNYSGEKFSITCNKGWPLLKLKEKIEQKLSVSAGKLEFNYKKSEGGEKKLSTRDDESTLSDLKFYHTMTLHINMKDSEIPMVELKKNDQGEDLITVLLSDELNPSNTIQHLILKDWRVKDLIQEVKIVFNIDPALPVRLRKLVTNKLIYKEDVEAYLKNIPEFLEGGYRFQVERGDLPDYGLIVLKVAFNSADEYKEIFVRETEKIYEVKNRAAEVLAFEPALFKLYRTDWLGEPINALKQENSTLFKAAIKDGDRLLVKPVDTVVESETLRLHLFVTNPSNPVLHVPVSELSLPEDTLLSALKEMVQQNSEVNPLNKPFVRIREMTKTMWPGKVFKENNKTLKKLSISFGASLLVQPMDEAESSSFTGLNIYVGIRHTQERCNKDIRELFFDAGASPNIDNLYTKIIEVYGNNWDIKKITLARFKANSFEWEVLKDDRPAEERGKLLNVRPSTTAQDIYNLKKKPYFIKDGDLFSVKIDEGEDDFVCIGDAEAREAYLKRRQTTGNEKKIKKIEKSIKIGDF